MTTVAVLDIIDVARILPVLSKDVYKESIFQNVYCTLGVFHELTVAIFLVSMAIAVCVQAGKEQKVCARIILILFCNIQTLFPWNDNIFILFLQYYGGGNNPTASLAQKIFIPLALLVGAGISIPLGLPDLLKNSYAKLDHHCTDWTRVKNLWKTIANGTDTGTDEFHSDLYSTVVAAFTYIIPVRVFGNVS